MSWRLNRSGDIDVHSFCNVLRDLCARSSHGRVFGVWRPHRWSTFFVWMVAWVKILTFKNLINVGSIFRKLFIACACLYCAVHIWFTQAVWASFVWVLGVWTNRTYLQPSQNIRFEVKIFPMTPNKWTLKNHMKNILIQHYMNPTHETLQIAKLENYFKHGSFFQILSRALYLNWLIPPSVSNRNI